MASEQELLNEAGEIVVEAISRMRAAHVACLDLTTHAEAFLRALNTRPAPAATDTGLETVEYQVEKNGKWYFDHPQSWAVRKSNGATVRELCVRSQAEELLAAERAEKEEARRAEEEAKDCFWSIYETYLEKGGLPVSTEGARSALSNRIASLEADNAAKNARIKELEADLMCAKASRDSWKRTHEESFSRLETKLAAAEKALETKSAANEALSKSVVESIDTEKRLREALEPFSKFAGAVFEHNFNNTDVIFEISASDGGVLELKGKDFFEARAVLGGKPEGRKSEN